VNDFLFMNADTLGLVEWGGSGAEAIDESTINDALRSLSKLATISEFVEDLSKELAKYDWRSSDADGLSEEEALLKAAFRGSGGYRQLRIHVLKHLSKVTGALGRSARDILEVLGE
jgi:hypothetical protein